MKKLIQRGRLIKIEPYGRRLYVNVSNDIFQAFKASEVANLGKINPSDKAVAFLWTRKSCNDMFMFLPLRPSVDTISHEAFHVTRFVMDLSDVPCADDSEEAWAYMQGYISGEIYEFVHEKRKKVVDKETTVEVVSG